MTAHSWTDDRVDEMLSLLKRGMTSTQIGRQMGMSRSAISGQIHRMKRTDNDRLMASGYGKMMERGFNGGPFRRDDKRRLMDELAEHLSEGVSIVSAAGKMNISVVRADLLFSHICAGLGAQAV